MTVVMSVLSLTAYKLFANHMKCKHNIFNTNFTRVNVIFFVLKNLFSENF